ncbi:MAG: hypothetical protein H0V88_02660 [Pyrinomonadaceae bacterium]|nr:hypothetical protein [Pyrinomonadaceae bacterium]
MGQLTLGMRTVFVWIYSKDERVRDSIFMQRLLKPTLFVNLVNELKLVAIDEMSTAT